MVPSVRADGTTSKTSVTVVVGAETKAEHASSSAGVVVSAGDGRRDGNLPNLGGPAVLALMAALVAVVGGTLLVSASRRRDRSEVAK